MTEMVIPGVTDTRSFSQSPLGSITAFGDGPPPFPEATATLSLVLPFLPLPSRLHALLAHSSLLASFPSVSEDPEAIGGSG